MKELICAQDVEALRASGGSAFTVKKGAIITPAARDCAAAAGIKFCFSECGETEKKENGALSALDSQSLYKAIKLLMEKGVLPKTFEPYEAERHQNGLKVVRGATVRMDRFDTGLPGDAVTYQELVSKEDAHISAGFLSLDHTRFDWKLDYEEIDYVIEGTLSVTLEGKTFTARAGDVLFVPSGSRVSWGSPDKAKVFYATYPANWADLV